MISENLHFSSILKETVSYVFLVNLLIEGFPQLFVMSSLLFGELSSENGFGRLRHLFQNVLQEYMGVPGDESFISE